MNEQMFSVGPIMKAARKFKKLNQAEVAQAIGCSQSALSKMEHNLLVPSAPQWFLFARFTKIPPETLETGIIDRRTPVKFNSPDVSMGFKLPKRYRTSRAEKVRELYPFLQSLERENPELVKEFIASTGIDPEFFLDFDNLINFQLITDMISFYIKHGKDSEEEVKKIVEVGQNEIYWNHFRFEWKKLQGVHEVLNEFAKDQLFFQTDFQIKVDQVGDKVQVSYYPEFHLKQIGNVTEDVVRFLNTYRRLSLESLLFRVQNKDVKVELIQDQGLSLGARFEVNAA